MKLNNFVTKNTKKDLAVAFLIPTYNAAEFLGRCLESIRRLDYPQDRLEVLVADGGSTDNTISIANQYGATILENKKRTAEYGKKIAFDNSTAEVVVFLDADNVIASKDWLNKLLIPLDNPDITGVESNYLINSDFSSLNKYATLLVIVDPLARMLASRPASKTSTKTYNIKSYSINSTPVAGANGFLWKRNVIEKYNRNPEELNEVLLLDAIAQKETVKIANVPSVGIYHYYCSGLKDYVKKRKKIANKHLERGTKTSTWVSKRGNLKLILSSAYLVSIIGPLSEGLYQGVKQRQIAWLWHPIISLTTVFIYFSSFSLRFLDNYSGNQL